jgi:hypothetical protein
MLTGLAAVFLLAALILLQIYRRQRRHGGLPTGDLIYSDAAAQEAPVLISRRYGLKGKPDALVRTASGDVIPVERKKSRAPKRPYPGDMIQATAYCVLVEDNYGRTPPFMRIQYADRALMNRTLSKGKTGFFRPAIKSGEHAGSELLTVRIQHREDAVPVGSVRIAVKLYDTSGRGA